jgi:hypothetical protein
MGRIRPMVFGPSAWRPADGACSSLAGSRPTAEAVRPASVRPAAETARQLALAGATCTRYAVTLHVACQWTGHGKVGVPSTLAQRRRRLARVKAVGLTLAAARREGAERRRRG